MFKGILDMTINEVEAAALSLDLSGQAALAEKLLRSLEDLSQEEIEQLWADEALRRDQELDAGTQRPETVKKCFANSELVLHEPVFNS